MTRLLIAAAISMAVSLFGTQALILFLNRHHIGQPIRDDGPEGHHTKAGTPTMGGLAVVAGAVTGYVVSDLFGGIYTRSGIFVMLASRLMIAEQSGRYRNRYFLVILSIMPCWTHGTVIQCWQPTGPGISVPLSFARKMLVPPGMRLKNRQPLVLLRRVKQARLPM